MLTGFEGNPGWEHRDAALGHAAHRTIADHAADHRSCNRFDGALSLSHGLGMGDALIAATALESRLVLITANIKHFGAVAGLQIERFDPADDAQ